MKDDGDSSKKKNNTVLIDSRLTSLIFTNLYFLLQIYQTNSFVQVHIFQRTLLSFRQCISITFWIWTAWRYIKTSILSLDGSDNPSYLRQSIVGFCSLLFSPTRREITWSLISLIFTQINRSVSNDYWLHNTKNYKTLLGCSRYSEHHYAAYQLTSICC